MYFTVCKSYHNIKTINNRRDQKWVQARVSSARDRESKVGEERAVREMGPRPQALERQGERGTGRAVQKTGYSNKHGRLGWEQEKSADLKTVETTPPPF